MNTDKILGREWKVAFGIEKETPPDRILLIVVDVKEDKQIAVFGPSERQAASDEMIRHGIESGHGTAVFSDHGDNRPLYVLEKY